VKPQYITSASPPCAAPLVAPYRKEGPLSVQEGSLRAFVNRIGKVSLAEVASEAKASVYVFLLLYAVSIVVWPIVRWMGLMIGKPSPV
jgi:hypothetical protein